MRKLYAKLFCCDLTIEQIFTRLNEVGPWQWIQRDNDRWGPYMSAAPTRNYQRTIVKILAEGREFAVNVSFRADDPGAEAEYEALRVILFEHLLPAIGARDLRETDDYE